jgi:hypothetical protein
MTMKISPDRSSFSSAGGIDSMSERSSQDYNSIGVNETCSHNRSDEHTQKEVRLAHYGMLDLTQAHEHIAVVNKHLTGQVNKPSLSFACHGTMDLTSNEAIVISLTMQMTNLQDLLKMGSEESNELAITLQQENWTCSCTIQVSSRRNVQSSSLTCLT